MLQVLEPIKATLEYAELRTSDISDIVLVGGSTRIPRIRQLITKYFDGKVFQIFWSGIYFPCSLTLFFSLSLLHMCLGILIIRI